ncbi:hypothetical protein EPO34_03350 [Patescibacteria group bacterium]|nr:MAG: hypothetical protein EPO34_03350 [Patescibacteria group bacterium]
MKTKTAFVVVLALSLPLSALAADPPATQPVAPKAPAKVEPKKKAPAPKAKAPTKTGQEQALAQPVNPSEQLALDINKEPDCAKFKSTGEYFTYMNSRVDLLGKYADELGHVSLILTVATQERDIKDPKLREAAVAVNDSVQMSAKRLRELAVLLHMPGNLAAGDDKMDPGMVSTCRQMQTSTANLYRSTMQVASTAIKLQQVLDRRYPPPPDADAPAATP